MVFIVRNMKSDQVHLTTEDFEEALTTHTFTPDSWIDTVDADIEDLTEGPYYPDALFQ